MQEQNFEKQVQKKLEELNLSPSTPVWKKVEEQIRKKKDRRRIFFWLLPFALLGGGVYFYSVSDKPVEKTDATGIANEILQGNKGNNNQNPSVTTLDNSSSSNDQSTTQKHSVASPTDKPSSELEVIAKHPIKKSAKNYRVSTKLTASRRRDENRINQDALISAEETKERNEKTEIKQEKNSINGHEKAQNNEQMQGNEKIIDTNSEKPVDNAPVNNNNIVPDSSADKNTVIDTTNKAPSPSETKDTLAVAAANEIDTTQKTQAKVKSRKPWKLSASLAGGSSGIATSAFGNLSQGGAASLDAVRFYNVTSFAQNTPNGPVTAPNFPSDIKNAFSFAIGGGLNKELSERLQFSTGLFYHFYSTSISVGKKVYRADTITRENKSIRIENFYQPSNSAETDTYKNNYHFFEVPIGLEWQVVRTIPLQLQTGFRIGRLIKTDALHYDGQQGIYYEDKELFKRTQVSFYTGILYRILKINKASLYIGPKAQFQLSNLLKKKSFGEQHLYFTGIETRISF